MAILKLKHNSIKFETFDLAKSGITEKMKDAQTGELWAGDYGEGAVLGFKGADGVVTFCDAVHVTSEMKNALSYYYTKTEIDNKITNVQNNAISVIAGNGISVTSEGTEKTISQNIGLRITTNETNGKDYLQIVDGSNSELIAEIDASQFVVDGMLKDATYDASKHTLTLVWNLGTGEDKTLEVNLTDLVDTYTAGNGLTLDGNKFNVQVDSDSESFLSVGQNGIKVSGVQTAIGNAKTEAINTAKTEAINTVKDYKVNGQAFNYSGWTVNAEHIGMSTIVGVETDNVQQALESLKKQITAAVSDGVTSVLSGTAITVDTNNKNNPQVSLAYNTTHFTVNDGDNLLALNIIDCGTY